MIYALALFFAMLLTTVLVPPLMRLATHIGMVDVPDARKVHSGVIPRSGGLALVAGALVPLFFLARSRPYMLGICLGSVLVLIEGVVDDVWGLSSNFKFAGQILAAVVTVYATHLHFVTLGALIPFCSKVNCSVIGYPLTVFFLVATTNVINLSDGLDGLAGGICLLIFAATGFLAFVRTDFATIALCVCMAGAIVGFLRYNDHPAVVFLGDAGSQFMGFMAGVVVLLFTNCGVRHSPILAMYFLGVPVLDTLMAIVRRAVEKRPLFKPDKSHLHHRLLQMGLTHHQAVTVIHVAQLLMIVVGWSLRKRPDVLFVLYLCLISFAVAAVFFDFWHFGERLARNGNGNGVLHRNNGALSKKFVSGAAWASLTTALLVFYMLTPLWMWPIPSDIGFYSLGFMFALAVAMIVRPGLFVSATKLAGYFLAIYYIMALDFGAKSPGLLWNYGGRWFLLVIFVLMAGSYLLYLVSAVEKVPFLTMDYLLLGLVALTFLLPEPIRAKYNVHIIATEILLVFLSLELVIFKVRGRTVLLALAAFPSLAMNLMMALWPWVL